MKYTLSFLLLTMLSFSLNAQDLIGKWKTIDDETGKAKSIVEISLQDGVYVGTIVELFRSPEEDQDPICNSCTDDRKDQKIKGMQIVRGMEKDDDEFKDGTICDPKNGKIYDCKMWIEDDPNVLFVRGYVAFFFRTQEWIRVK